MDEESYYSEISRRLDRIGCLKTRMEVMDKIILSAIVRMWDNEIERKGFMKRVNKHFEDEGV